MCRLTMIGEIALLCNKSIDKQLHQLIHLFILGGSGGGGGRSSAAASTVDMNGSTVSSSQNSPPLLLVNSQTKLPCRFNGVDFNIRALAISTLGDVSKDNLCFIWKWYSIELLDVSKHTI